MSDDNEVRVTSATGGEKGSKLPRLGGADAEAMRELARVYGFGEAKYARYNYLKGYPWSLSIDALYRHLLAFQAGEDKDRESGLHHMAHVAWHALTLVAFSQRGIGTDDREPQAGPQEGHVLGEPLYRLAGSWEEHVAGCDSCRRRVGAFQS